MPGKDTLVGELLTRAGFTSYSARRGMAQGDYLPLERIVADPPAVLLVAGDERGQHNPILAHIPGLSVARFDPSLVYCGGPSIPRAMARLRAVRHASGIPFKVPQTSAAPFVPSLSRERFERSREPGAGRASASLGGALRQAQGKRMEVLG